MIKLDKYTRVRSVEDVRAELEEFNRCVDVLRDAMTWLEEATKDKLDKRATVAILDKINTEYRSYHCKERELGAYKWSITMTDGYRDDKRIDITLYKKNEHGYYSEVRNFDYTNYSYPKGATWAEVWDEINKYVKPHYKTIDEDKMQVYHDKLQAMVEDLKELEAESDRIYKEEYWYLEKFLKEY